MTVDIYSYWHVHEFCLSEWLIKLLKHLNVQRTALCNDVAYSFRLLPPSMNLSADALWPFGNQNGRHTCCCCCCCLLACRDCSDWTVRKPYGHEERKHLQSLLCCAGKTRLSGYGTVTGENVARWLTLCKRRAVVRTNIFSLRVVLMLTETVSGEKVLSESSLLPVVTTSR